jgi:hypothetical protein
MDHTGYHQLHCVSTVHNFVVKIDNPTLGSNALDNFGVGVAGWTALGQLRGLEALDLSVNPGLTAVHRGGTVVQMLNSVTLESVWFQHLNLNYDLPVSNFALSHATCTATPGA